MGTVDPAFPRHTRLYSLVSANRSSVGSGERPPGEVLALAAAYLRLPEADVLRLVEQQGLPARQLAMEWRFLKPALQEWLRTGPPPKPSMEAQFIVAGFWKDDPLVEEELREINCQRRRSRPETES